MKTRPRELTALALSFVGIAVAFPAQVVLLFGDSIWDWSLIATKLAPLNWLIIGSSLVMIPLTLRASPLLWVAVPAYIAEVTWNNWLVASVQVGRVGHEAHPWLSPVHLSTLGIVLLLFGTLSRPSARMALFNPSRRWWLTPRRKQVKLKARVCPVTGGELSTQSFDLSEGGIFLALDAESKWREPKLRKKKTIDELLTVGSYCWLRISFEDRPPLTCTAEIVRKTDPRGTYPAGMGLRFVGLTPEDRKLLVNFLKTVRDALPGDVAENASDVAPVDDTNEDDSFQKTGQKKAA